jgi:hypothetical protein
MKRILVTAVVAGSAFLATECEAPKVAKTTTMKVNKVVYSVEVLPRENSRHAGPLRQKMLEDNLAVERTVYFDGKRSSTVEVTNDYGFRGITTIIRDSNSWRYSKQLPYINVWFKAEDPLSGEIQSEPPIVTLFDEQKTLLGYTCKKATIEKEYKRFVIWYAPDLKTDDPTEAILQEEDIPGTILEMDEYLTSGDVDWYTRYKVTSIDLDVKDASVLEIPKGAVKMNSPDEAAEKNRELFEKAMATEKPLTREEKEVYLGTWRLNYKGDIVELLVERFGDDTYSLTETRIIGGKRTQTKHGLVRFYGPRLFFDEAPAWKTYVLTKNGELQQEQNNFYTFRKQK